MGITDYKFINYSEHAKESGADSKAVAYIQLEAPNGGHVFGVGMENNISLASIRGTISAINRAIKSASEEKR